MEWRNKYLASRLTGKEARDEDYKVPPPDQVRATIIDAGDDKKKISVTKLDKAVQHLLYFNPDPTLMDPLITVLDKFVIPEKDDRKLLPLVHYHLVLLFDETYARTGGLNLYKEIHKSVPLHRRIPAIRTYSIITSLDANSKTMLLETLSEVLRTGKESEADKSSSLKKGIFSSSASRPNLINDKDILHTAALSACRQRFVRTAPIFMPIVSSLQIDDPIGSRHASALILEYARENASVVATPLHKYLPHLRGKESVELQDPMARVYLSKTCAEIGHNRSIDNSDDYYQALCMGILDISSRVFLESVVGLSKGSWFRLLYASITPNEGGETFNVITEIVNRMTEFIEAGGKTPLLHACCRTIKILAESYIISCERGEISTEDQVSSKHPLFGLMKTLQALVKRSKLHLRLQALKALLWIPYSSDIVFSLDSVLLEELQNNTLPASLFGELFRELNNRVKVTPAISDWVLSLLYNLYNYRSDIINVNIISEIWRTIFYAEHGGRQKVLQSIFQLLDHPYRFDNRLYVFDVRKDILLFLGDYAVTLSDDGKLAGEYANVLNEVHHREHIPHHHHHGAPVNHTLEILNPALKAIILRLQHFATFGTSDVRAICVESLAKIAAQTDFPVRLHIYEFLVCLFKDPDSNLQATIHPLLKCFDRLFAQLEKKATESDPVVAEFLGSPVTPIPQSRMHHQQRASTGEDGTGSVILTPR